MEKLEITQVQNEIALENLYPSWEELLMHNKNNPKVVEDFEAIVNAEYSKRLSEAEKLPNLIQDILLDEMPDGHKEASQRIASEVKDIAIAFAEYAAKYWDKVSKGQAPMKSDSELFSDFISNYYK